MQHISFKEKNISYLFLSHKMYKHIQHSNEVNITTEAIILKVYEIQY